MTTEGPSRELPRVPSDPAPRRRILIVDDQAEVRSAFAKYLELTGFDVTDVGDAKSAIEAVAAGPPFLALLTDLSLRDDDGREVARRVRAIAPATWIAIITGWPVEPEEYASWGIDRVFFKPVNLADLRRALDDLGPGPR